MKRNDDKFESHKDQRGPAIIGQRLPDHQITPRVTREHLANEAGIWFSGIPFNGDFSLAISTSSGVPYGWELAGGDSGGLSHALTSSGKPALNVSPTSSTHTDSIVSRPFVAAPGSSFQFTLAAVLLVGTSAAGFQAFVVWADDSGTQLGTVGVPVTGLVPGVRAVLSASGNVPSGATQGWVKIAASGDPGTYTVQVDFAGVSAGVPSGVVTGSGTPGQLAAWTGPHTLGDGGVGGGGGGGAPGWQTLVTPTAYGQTIAWDVAQGDGELQLDFSCVIANPTNLAEGGVYCLKVTQGAAGDRGLYFQDAFRFPGGARPTISQVAGATDILAFVSDGTLLYLVEQTQDLLAPPALPNFAAPPAQVSGLVLWLKGDSISGVADGGDVTSWLDESGNSNDATTALGVSAVAPKYVLDALNGQPGILMNASRSGLGTPLTFSSHDYTMIMVCSTVVADSTSRRVVQSKANNWAVGGFTSSWRAYTGAAFLSDGALVANEWKIFTVDADSTAANIRLFDNNVQAGPVGALSALPGQVCLGAAGEFNENARGHLLELIVYSGRISDVDRSFLHTYLREKYGLT